MSNKRRQFIDRLLRISEINQELLDIGDKNRQPATTKRIKLIQMGKAEFNMPPCAPAVLAPKHNCKILFVDRPASRYTSEGHSTPKMGQKNETIQSQIQNPEPYTYRKMIQKRKSTDAHLQKQYQVNFVSPVEYEIKNNALKHTEQFNKRPHSSYKAKSTTTSSKTLFQSDIEGLPSHLSGKNILNGKTIKFSRSNTLNIERDKKAQEQRKAKIEKMKQINKNYAKPFNPPPKLTAKSYIVCEVINHVIKPLVCYNSKNSQEVASLTKIMTCILIIQIAQQYKINIDEEQIKIGRYEANIGGTTAAIKPGQIYTVKQLLYGLMLPSGNDASLALAVWGGRKLLENGSDALQSGMNPSFGIQIMLKKITKGTCYTRFIKEMNEKAKKVGMNKTKYANSHGLSNSSNRSTAYDIALLSNYAMKHSLFRQVVSCKFYDAYIKYTVQNNQPKGENENDTQDYDEPLSPQKKPVKMMSSQMLGANKELQSMHVRWQNTHKLLHSKPSQYIGIKTGITPTAGPCLSSMLTLQKRQFIIIVLGCHKTSYRFKQTETLKKWLCKHTGMSNKIKKTMSLKQQKMTQEGFSNSEEEDFNEND